MTFYSISCSSFNLFRYTYINPSHSYGTAVGTAYCSTVPFLLLLIIIRFRIKVPGPTCNFAAFPPTACNFNGYTVYHQGPATQIDINRRQAARTGGGGRSRGLRPQARNDSGDGLGVVRAADISQECFHRPLETDIQNVAIYYDPNDFRSGFSVTFSSTL